MFSSCSSHDDMRKAKDKVYAYGSCNNGVQVIAFKSVEEYEIHISNERVFKLEKTVNALYNNISKIIHPSKLTDPCRERFRYFEYLIAEMFATSVEKIYLNMKLTRIQNPYDVVRNFTTNQETTSASKSLAEEKTINPFEQFTELEKYKNNTIESLFETLANLSSAVKNLTSTKAEKVEIVKYSTSNTMRNDYDYVPQIYYYERDILSKILVISISLMLIFIILILS